MPRIIFFFALLSLTLALHAQATTPRAQLDRLVAQNPVFAGGHTGFSLYDIDREQPVYGYQADHYFVPASNVKLLTFLVAHRVLGQSVPALYYQRGADRLDIWGTGYPLLLHPSFRGYDELAPWLRQQVVPIVLHQPEAETPPRYGAGWSWDDFNYGYVYERTALPIYGNRLHLERDPDPGLLGSALLGSPPEVAGALVMDADQPYTIRRGEEENVFTVNENIYKLGDSPLQRALHTSGDFTLRQLREAFPALTIGGHLRPRPPP